mgnify:CR=1 FL=1
MPEQYGVFAILLLVTLMIPLGGYLISFLVRPRKPYAVKKATYECGLETIGDTWIQFKVQYYIYALIFVVFDIETVFIYPWAVAYQQMGLFVLVEMAIFIGILVVGLAYAWRKGALQWI